ncbi:nucleoside diphosphate-linked moiety X motif 8 [Drosophila innubila]|uniref:nucleoside diphosphate-linked moiety X motif 8 n=1 Tax=Drosophila innubila TaxID=198719 RepID=UPI00148BFB79|nr:nucleoside diphosphate-linked moiety X motif 8 [Drosophila innubila]
MLCSEVIKRQLLQLTRRQMSSSSNRVAPIGNVLTNDDFTLLLADEQRQKCMDKLRNLPTFERTRTMAHNKREKRSAAVFIALCVERDTNAISLLYTRRSRHLRSHSLQISFPGGKRDDDDASFLDCALRETEEEIGLPRDRVQTWGESNPILLPRTSAIVPVIGVVKDFHVSELKLNCDEVEEVISIPLKSLLLPSATRHTQFRSGYSGPVFVVDQHRIWGITGYLTYVFLRCLLPSHMMCEALKTSIKFIRPYKIPPKLIHHHVEPKLNDKTVA